MRNVTTAKSYGQKNVTELTECCHTSCLVHIFYLYLFTLVRRHSGVKTLINPSKQ